MISLTQTILRRWFIVEHNQLLYCSQHRSRDGAVVLEKDLRCVGTVMGGVVVSFGLGGKISCASPASEQVNTHTQTLQCGGL